MTPLLPQSGLTPRQPHRAYRRCHEDSAAMIDNFALLLAHGLMMLTALLLLRRPDLDREAKPHDAVERRRRRA
jgi:hypothetical protein